MQLIENSPLHPHRSRVCYIFLFLGPTLTSFPFIYEMKGICSSQGQCLHMQISSQLPPVCSSLAEVSCILSFPLCWIISCHCTNCPANPCFLQRTLWALHNIFYFFNSNTSGMLSVFTHSTSSPPFLSLWLFSIWLLSFQLKTAPAWLLPGCLELSSVINRFLFILLWISA